MKPRLGLEFKLQQRLVLTPQLQQAIKLLQLSRLELQQTLSQQLMENPLLEETPLEAEEASDVQEQEQEQEWDAARREEVSEESGGENADEPQHDEAGWEEYFDGGRRAGDVEYPGSGKDDLPTFDQTAVKPTSLEEHLLWQLGLAEISEEEKSIGRLIIGNLDEDGYLRAPIDELAADCGCSPESVESVLRLVQTFDPAGVAARDLRECLLLQLGCLNRDFGAPANRPSQGVKGTLVEEIVTHHMRDLEKKQYGRIAKLLGVSTDEVFKAVRVIEVLEPKPGRPFFSSQDNYVVVPDVFVFKNEGEWEVRLNEDGLPRLRIAPYYKKIMGAKHAQTEETKVYLDEKLRGAQWIIRSIEQRNKTIVKVVTSIVKFQESFFERGIEGLRPLVLKQVAEDIGMHESTISRVTANKYLYCQQGLYELKYFFNAGLQCTDPHEEMLSSETVREMIRRMVAEEDARRPLRDQEIVARLRSQNVLIARRTVAKYRSEVNIPSASQRKRLF